MSLTVFSFWPYILFAVIEPLCWFIRMKFAIAQLLVQLPIISTSDAVISPYQPIESSFILHMLAANFYYTSSDPRIIRQVVNALAFNDIADIIGLLVRLDQGVQWSIITWLSIFVTLFLFTNRTLYLHGLFDNTVKDGEK
ncbi:uncharacterized protein KD926_006133 [Aspergillus affinis]|uniref:uncharacterized protein n=1 Tax=Aspergillus affinis TaxID=1070780 RepID=UPI0022FF17EE|nr:uncharacterized protein KD926_006133 [Aspergillus affinis]KAI9034742.1 hypothetical protein KD926_006133 [Aspergillus affinis]